MYSGTSIKSRIYLVLSALSWAVQREVKQAVLLINCNSLRLIISAYFFILSLRTECPGLHDLMWITKLGKGGLYYPGRNKEKKKRQQKIMIFSSPADSRSDSMINPAATGRLWRSQSKRMLSWTVTSQRWGNPLKSRCPLLAQEESTAHDPTWDWSNCHFWDAVPGISLGFTRVPPAVCWSQLAFWVPFRGESLHPC